MPIAQRLFLWLLLFSPFVVWSQTYTVSGYVSDANSGETLIGTNIYIKNDPGRGTASNAYGFYSLTLEKGNYELVFSYLGFQDQTLVVNLQAKQTLDVAMSEGLQLAEVVVTGEAEDKNVQDTKMGTVAISTRITG
jgi:hypothetical protein